MELEWNGEKIARWGFKQPTFSKWGWATRSFGIEPYKVNPVTRLEVKASAAIVRIRYVKYSLEAHKRAVAIADEITMRLNRGEEYVGPKTITANARKPMPNTEAWFL